MSHSHGGGAEIMENFELAQVYWIFAGGAIAIAGLVNLKEKLIYRNRYVMEFSTLPYANH